MKKIGIFLAVLLLLCLAPMPYTYYIIVRFAAMVVFAIIAYQCYEQEKTILAITFGVLALLFQPILKIALGRTLWNIVDIIAAILLLLYFFSYNKTRKRQSNSTSNYRQKNETYVKNNTYVEDKKYDFRDTTDVHTETYNNKASQVYTTVKQDPATKKVTLPSEQQEASQILKLLKENGIEYFYHFTSKRNLESIKKHGGLYSWKELEKRGINAPFIGGSGDNGLSHNLDLKAGLADYVRLSFCKDHPMSFRHKQKGEPIVLLAIDITVATQPNTKFSNINATDNMCTVAEGLEGLKLVDFNAVKRTHVSRDDSDFKLHQAEILVKNHIPIKYIKGIIN